MKEKILVDNHLWRFDTGIMNITNSTTLNASESILVLIASNYTNNGFYRTSAYANSSNYNDSETGLILT
jgi:hypothetical protein